MSYFIRLISGITKPALLLMLCLIASTAFADVVVSGLNGAIKDNVLLMLSIAREKCDAPEWRIQGLFENADPEIDEALRALGYYHGVTKKSLAFHEQCWKADFRVDPGPQTIVSDVNIVISGDAKEDKQFIKLLKKMPLKKGSPVNHALYENMKSRIEALALDRGYLEGRFTESKLLIDKQNNTAQIKLDYAAGKRMLFGDVVVEQTILEPAFVKKYLSIKEGDFYSSEQLAETHTALSKSGYFEIIDIHPDTEKIQQQRVPVTLKLSPKNRYHYSFGIGFDTDIGPLLSAAYIDRRLNQRGHFLNANLDLSPVLSTAVVDYTIPLANPVNDFFSIGAGFKREDTDSYQSLSATLSGRLKHVFENGWKQTLFLDYSYEDFDTGATTGHSLLLVPGGNWLHSHANNPIRPTKGHRVELEVKGSIKNPVSYASFIQGHFSGVWIHKLPLRGKFIGRGELGATLVDEFDNLPTTYRFYAGGINSVRGYAYKELGPKDSLGDVEGGQFLTTVSAEYEQAFLENWGVAAFVDSGNAFNPDSIQLKTGVGIGLRWYSPLGPIRLDFALPLNESDSSFQIHFAAGTRL